MTSPMSTTEHEPHATHGLNFVEVVMCLVYATHWALVAGAVVLSDMRHGRSASLQPLQEFFAINAAPLPVCVFSTVFVVALSVHLFVAYRGVARERFGDCSPGRAAVVTFIVLVFSVAIVG